MATGNKLMKWIISSGMLPGQTSLRSSARPCGAPACEEALLLWPQAVLPPQPPPDERPRAAEAPTPGAGGLVSPTREGQAHTARLRVRLLNQDLAVGAQHLDLVTVHGVKVLGRIQDPV